MNYKGKYLEDLRFFAFLYQKAFAASRFFWVYLLLQVVANTCSTLLWVFIPKYIIDELTGTKSVETVLWYIGVFVVLQIVCGMVNQISVRSLEVCNERIDHYLRKDLAGKVMRIQYESLEDTKVLDLKDRASEGLDFWGGIIEINSIVVEVLSALLSIGTLIVLVARLNLLFMFLLLAFVIGNTLLNNRLRLIVLHFWDKLGIFNRQFGYLADLMTDYQYGKDIRLYHMSDLILKKGEGYRKDTLDYYVKQGKLERKFLDAQKFILLLQNLTVYGYVVYCAHTGSVGIGSLVMYLSAATTIVSNSTKAMQYLLDMKRIFQYALPYMEFMKLPEAGEKGTEPIPKADHYGLSLRGVSFHYPGSERYVLKDVWFDIASGEKVSIVGLNGAGKTTLIKLLLRLYEPTEGEILLNGMNINHYCYEEYLQLFSVVFQDFELFAGSVDENVSGDGAGDQERIEEALKKVGLLEKIHSLPKGRDTQLLKHFHEDGVELSGGQNQKLAIARAIYKDSAFVFLDEPTANLDPIAEYEIFTDFDRLVHHKTTVYISHRLSTCRLSDKIVVINEGTVAQMGCHDELVKQDGLYREMWEAQAGYYR